MTFNGDLFPIKINSVLWAIEGPGENGARHCKTAFLIIAINDSINKKTDKYKTLNNKKSCRKNYIAITS